MQQDQQGRPLSDDGQWVWNGTQWEAAGSSTAGSPAAASRPTAQPGTETLVAPRPALQAADAAPAPGPAQDPAGPDASSNTKPRSSRASAFGTAASGGGSGPRPGSRLPDMSSNRNRLIAGIGAALVVLVLILVVLLVAAGGSDKAKTAAAPGPVAPSVPSAPSAAPSASASAGTPSTFARPSGAAATLGPALGLYTCRVKDKATGMDRVVGTFTLTDSKYTTTFGGSGDWAYDKEGRGVVFIGRDLSDFDGRFDPASGRVALTAKTDKSLVVTCAQ